MKNLLNSIIYVILFYLSSKVVFALFGGFQLSKGALGIDWVGLLYITVISLLAAFVLALGLLVFSIKQNIKSIVQISLLSILFLNLYQFIRSPSWFLSTLLDNFIHTFITNLVFGVALVIMYLLSSKANKALKTD